MSADSNFLQYDPSKMDDALFSDGPWANAWNPTWEAGSTDNDSVKKTSTSDGRPPFDQPTGGVKNNPAFLGTD